MTKVAIITGASRGIGAATAVRLASDGFDICVNYLSSEQAATEVVEQAQAGAKTNGKNINAISIQADISSEQDVNRLFETVDRELGTPYVLVNNAGILFQQCRVEEMNADRINKTLTTNVTGCFLCCREAVTRMSTKKGGDGGVIVNLSSAAARIGSAGEYVDYAASKGAIDTLTLGLAAEVADEGIRVNAIRAGFIYTDMHKSGGEPGRVDRLASTLPMKRGGQPAEVAAAISWLVSEESGYTTGSFLDVSGGR